MTLVLSVPVLNNDITFAVHLVKCLKRYLVPATSRYRYHMMLIFFTSDLKDIRPEAN